MLEVTYRPVFSIGSHSLIGKRETRVLSQWEFLAFAGLGARIIHVRRMPCQ